MGSVGACGRDSQHLGAGGVLILAAILCSRQGRASWQTALEKKLQTCVPSFVGRRRTAEDSSKKFFVFERSSMWSRKAGGS